MGHITKRKDCSSLTRVIYSILPIGVSESNKKALGSKGPLCDIKGQNNLIRGSKLNHSLLSYYHHPALYGLVTITHIPSLNNCLNLLLD